MISLRRIAIEIYLKIGRTWINERIARSAMRTIVATIRNFSTLRLLRYISPPPPNAGDKPPSGACSKITATKAIETIICAIEIMFEIMVICTFIIYVQPLPLQVLRNHDRAEIAHQQDPL